MNDSEHGRRPAQEAGRMRRLRYVAVAIAVAVVGPSVPGNAASAPAEANVREVRASVPEADVARFIALWIPRLANPAWMSSYIQGAGLPAEVEAEGFHRLDKARKLYLAHRLYERLVTLGIFARKDREKTAATRAVLYATLFDPAWAKRLTQTPEKPSSVPEAPKAEQQSRFTGTLDELKRPRTSEIPAAQVPEGLALPVLRDVEANDVRQSMGLPSVVPAAGEDTAAHPADMIELGPAPGGPVFGNPTNELPLSQPASGPLPDLGTADALMQKIRTTVDATTYAACAESATMPLKCQPTVPLGAPVQLDADGNGAPDVTVQLAPSAPVLGSLVAPDPALQLTVARLGAAAMPAHAFVVYEVAGADRRIALGFDGRANSLALESKAVVALVDPSAAAAGLVRLNLGLSHQTAAPTSTLTFGTKTLVYGVSMEPSETDPVAGSLRFDPAPGSFGLDLTVDRSPGHNEFVVKSALPAPATMTGTLRMDDTSEASRRDIGVTADKLPQQAKVVLAQLPTKEFKVDYTAGAPIGQFAFGDKTTPDTAKPGTYREIIATAASVPSDVHLTVAPGGKTQYSGGELGAVSFTALENTDGVARRVTSLAAKKVPGKVDLSIEQTPLAGTKILYAGSKPMSEATFGLVDLDSDELRATATAKAIPEKLEVSLEPQAAILDASAPIGSIEGTISTKGTPVATFTGSYGSVRQGPGGGMAAGFRLPGVRHAELHRSASEQVSFSLDAAAKPEPFFAYYEDPSIQANGTVAAMPGLVDVVLDPAGSFDYTASAPIAALWLGVTAGSRTASAEVTQIPNALKLTWDASGGATLDAAAPIKQIIAKASVGGGSGGSVPNVDYLVVRKKGTVAGADLKLRDVQSFSAQPTTGHYKLGLSPGGQSFAADVDLDGEHKASAFISALPKTIELQLKSGDDSFTYTAAAPIGSVTASYERVSTGESAYAKLTAVPTSISTKWTTGPGAASVTFDATSGPTTFHGFFKRGKGQAAVEVIASTLPRWMRVGIASERTSFDARSSAAAAPGSASLGTLQMKYGSNGSFLSYPSTVDHLFLKQDAALTQAQFRYTGLREASYEAVGGKIKAKLVGTKAVPFGLLHVTPSSSAVTSINVLPSVVTVAYDGAKTYSVTASSVIQEAWTSYSTATRNFTVWAKSIPASATVTIDPGAGTVAWQGSAPIPAAKVTAQIPAGGKTWSVGLFVEGLPVKWTLGFANGDVSFTGHGAQVGKVTGYATNHGTVTVPWSAPQFLGARYDQPSGNADVYLSLTGVRAVSHRRTTAGQELDLKSSGLPLTVDAAVLRDAVRAEIRGAINPLPSEIKFTQEGDAFSYTAKNQQFDVDVEMGYGTAAALAATQAPPQVHGLSVRDGKSCTATACSKGVKGRVFLTGFPEELKVDLTPPTPTDDYHRLVSIKNFRPKIGHLAIDARLDHYGPEPMQLNSTQFLTPSTTGYNGTVGPLYSVGQEDGSKKIRFDYDFSSPLGPLYANFKRGTDLWTLAVSNVPKSLRTQTLLQNGTTTVSLLQPGPIDWIYAGFKRVSDVQVQAELSLAQIPGGPVHLQFGRVSTPDHKSTMPGLSYSAWADTLDVYARVEASLFGGDVKARAELKVIDVGGLTTIGWDDGKVRLHSEPKTSYIEIAVWAELRHTEPVEFCFPWCNAGLKVSGSAAIDPLKVDELRLFVTDAQELVVKPGIASSIEGQYGWFHFGWKDLSLRLNVDITAEVCIEWCYFAWDVIDIDQVFDIDVLFYVFDDAWWEAMSLETYVWICDVDVRWDWSPVDATAKDIVVEFRPRLRGTSWNEFTVASAHAAGAGWVVMPNPEGFVPSFAMKVLAAAVNPMGDGFDASLVCK